MTRIAHLSDLHFGSESAATTAALIDELNREPLDLVILSGDLTMAARRDEYLRAGRFIEALQAPVLAVPGNHDITPFRIRERLTDPYARWRRYISRHIEPVWLTPEAVVVGLNTARRVQFGLNWANGSVSRRQIADLGSRFRAAGDTAFRIVVAHHPFLAEMPDGHANRRPTLVRRARRALAAFADARVDLLTSGHLHRTFTAAFDDGPALGGMTAGERGDARKVTVIQAGTALSWRTRGEPNSFNRIVIHDGALAVYPVVWRGRRWEQDAEPLVTLKHRTA